WSTSLLSRQQTGWAWFALMLANGEDLMAFRLLREDGERSRFDHGMLADGATQRVLQPDDFELLPLTYWTDPTGAEWPVVWELKIGDRRLLVRALLDDQLMDTLVVYWEGLVEVLEEGEIVGRGYMELTGYNR
ncbi:MAG: lipocalin family protein, partial [Proteobacteria bacterium]|nr:lipocalin family protein [Pseudomonadota bacterium]